MRLNWKIAGLVAGLSVPLLLLVFSILLGLLSRLLGVGGFGIVGYAMFLTPITALAGAFLLPRGGRMASVALALTFLAGWAVVGVILGTGIG